MRQNVLVQKMFTPTPRMAIGDSDGVGGLNSQSLKGKYGAKLEIPGRGGGGGLKYKLNNLGPWRYGYFLEPHNPLLSQFY